MARRRHTLRDSLLACLTAVSTTHAQTYYFSGAVTIHGSNGLPSAVPAQCPADHPVSCSSIQEADYCCPSNNYCTWSNSQVACCANDRTCSGWSSGGGGYKPSSYYAPETSTVYYHSTSTYYQPQTTGVVVAPAGVYGSTQANAGGYSGYCSTLYAQGPNLPTTAQGQCGTILVESPSEAVRRVVGWLRMGVMVVGLNVLGGLVLIWR